MYFTFVIVGTELCRAGNDDITYDQQELAAARKRAAASKSRCSNKGRSRSSPNTLRDILPGGNAAVAFTSFPDSADSSDSDASYEDSDQSDDEGSVDSHRQKKRKTKSAGAQMIVHDHSVHNHYANSTSSSSNTQNNGCSYGKKNKRK